MPPSGHAPHPIFGHVPGVTPHDAQGHVVTDGLCAALEGQRQGGPEQAWRPRLPTGSRPPRGDTGASQGAACRPTARATRDRSRGLREGHTRGVSSTAMGCRLLPQAPDAAPLARLRPPGGLRPPAGARGGVSAVEVPAGDRGPTLVGQDDAAGHRGRNRPKLALVLQPVAEAPRGLSDSRSRRLNRPCHHTPPCLEPSRPPDRRVACGSQPGKSQLSSKIIHKALLTSVPWEGACLCHVSLLRCLGLAFCNL